MTFLSLLRTYKMFYWFLRLVTVGFILIINNREYSEIRSYHQRVLKHDVKHKALVKQMQAIQTRHVLLWTQRRSGSRLSMHLLTALPRSFIMEEPLSDYKPGNVLNIINFLRDILNCRFSLHLEYFKKWIGRTMQEHSEITNICNNEASLCTDPELSEAMCVASQINLVKVVGEELGTAEHLLHDTQLNVRLVHLVRDPRALLASRLKTGKDFWPWVLGPGIYQDDTNLTSVCSRYQHDLTAARSFLRLYPHRYTLVRYEDLALHPESEVRRLYTFLHLPYTAKVANTVFTHTFGFVADQSILVHPFSTFKNSSATVFAWRKSLPFTKVEKIQEECGSVLEAYGYRMFPSPRHYHHLQYTPLLPLPSTL
ncbi:hypothetical protein Pcinc_036846 [Petrolisthes cinctipes]|uniref:Sulfotransferase domain-containing protein n=1 Tax=Petrolisthes cinctipes TaxID=88211 RepID=A0AAE1BVB9_PETCI|nr:hypothetical protein Pcinc_036846 [Petrolisthes cinctipes]